MQSLRSGLPDLCQCHVHHLANITQASTAFRIVGLTTAIPCLGFSDDLFHDGGSAMFNNILLQVIGCVIVAITNSLIHG
ncbi:hypothetical protein JYU00_00400 [bacterium AH-315-N22]|nr:hypothetical protein [bacterium AH-315-N22]